MPRQRRSAASGRVDRQHDFRKPQMKLTAKQKRMEAIFEKEFPFCMACGWPDGQPWQWRDYPRWLENAHILRGTGQRRIDRRAILRLCKLDHDIADGPDEPTQRDRAGNRLPKLTRPHLLWLKRERDPDHFDLDWLNSISIQRMPEPAAPPSWFLEQYARWQGVCP